MIRRTISLLAISLATLAALLPTVAQAAGPGWALEGLFSQFTNVAPSSTAYGSRNGYFFKAFNNGGAATSGSVTVTDTLPAGLTPTSANWNVSRSLSGGTVDGPCTIGSPTAQDVVCSTSQSVHVDDTLEVIIGFEPSSLLDGATVTNQVSVSGGGAPPAQASIESVVSASEPAFDFIDGANGLNAYLGEREGQPAAQAGSHPETLSVGVEFPTTTASAPGGIGFSTGAHGGVKDANAFLPQGLVVNPTAAPFCLEAQLESDACPDASAVGLARLRIGFAGFFAGEPDSLYNIKPPPGHAAAFSFNAAGVNIYPHILGGLHAGDYTLTALSDDILQRFGTPLLGISTEIWGDPSNPIHDEFRGECNTGIGPHSCPVDRTTTPMLTMPTSCAASLPLEAEAASWGDPGVFHGRSTEVADSLGNPTGVIGCGSLNYTEPTTEPSLKARPTTTVADAASGLEVDLHIPQHEDLNTLAEAHLKEAVVTLPEGLVINPSSGNGLQGCSSAQIGVSPATGLPNGNEPSCPDASKLGTVEVDTPLLDHVAPGAIYLATPHDNPFDSLLAIYVVVDDKPTGTLVKLSGHVEADPSTGRLTTTFSDNPQLPFEDFKLKFFGGSGGTLRTPAVCGAYSTTSSVTPWSGTPPAHPHDDYAISQAPGGGACPTSTGALPNSPDIDAGSVSPIAGASTPTVVSLRRADGSQEFSTVSLTLPPGLTGKLAGIGQCSEAALAAASQKSGHQEQASPSCPADSRIGTVNVAAGAGPAPYNTQGTAYLTGPYKGAPLGMAIVTPAVAGPYDLGTVVVRVALHVDPNTGQITATSDEIPHILQGIVLDIRSTQITLDRDNFTRNGTSCDPFAFAGNLVSTLGQSTPLSERFQLGECANLPFKPKLGIRLTGGTKRGAHPALKGTVVMPEGGANIAKAVVALPHSEFLDQAHIGTVCTRVQFAEGDGNGSNCPAASIYGTATATSPLVDYALSGNAYLRSSEHELPDLVVALHGPPSQPIAVDVVGRIDSVKGGIRTSFEGVPDLPVSSFVLSMQGAKKGLLQNSTNICKGKHKASAELDGQNGKSVDLRPALKNAKCGKAKKKHKRHGAHARPAQRPSR